MTTGAPQQEEVAWWKLGVPLSRVAGMDNIPAPNALADAFGDRYLYRHNPVYTAVRDAAIGFGYRFSADDTPLWRDYQSLPLASLRRIVEGKIIPYFDTGASFSRLANALPGATLPLGFIAASLKPNYTFHEAAHCVAHSILRGFEAELNEAAGEGNGDVLEAVLAEAFANTAEALGSTFPDRNAIGQLFYRVNSYYPPERRRNELMRKAAEELGAGTRFRLLFLSHVEANLSGGKPSAAVYGRVTEAGGCPVEYAGLAREITDAGFRLNNGFRDNTNPAWFGLFGQSREYEALAKSRWLDRQENRCFARAIAGVFQEAAGGV